MIEEEKEIRFKNEDSVHSLLFIYYCRQRTKQYDMFYLCSFT